MTQEEKAKEIARKNRINYYEGDIGWGDRIKSSEEECYDSAMEMAEWKDNQIKGFFFELALLLTTPKTNLEHSMRVAFPMSGFNEIDDILDFLHGKFLEYNNSGTILNDNNKS